MECDKAKDEVKEYLTKKVVSKAPKIMAEWLLAEHLSKSSLSNLLWSLLESIST